MSFKLGKGNPQINCTTQHGLRQSGLSAYGNNRKSMLEPHELFIDRVCPNCGNTRFSISLFGEIQPFKKAEPSILGMEDCTCEGCFCIRLNPRLEADVLATFSLKKVDPKTAKKALRIIFHPIDDANLKIKDLDARCQQAQCNGKHIIRIHNDFKKAFMEKLRYPEIKLSFINEDELISIEKALFEVNYSY